MKWFKEPLLQFLLLGAFIFVFYRWQQPPPVNQISVPASLDAAAREQFINETVLIREAQKLGLDKNDSIINRQLQQKMRALLEAAATDQISDAELAAWIDRQPERYGQAPRVDVMQRLFRRSQHPNSYQAAQQALAATNNTSNALETEAETLLNVSQRELRRRYGESFAIAVFAEQDKAWHGPVNSGLGSHLFKVIQHHTAAAANFDEVKQRALTDWRAAQETEAFIQGLAERRKAYSIINDE